MEGDDLMAFWDDAADKEGVRKHVVKGREHSISEWRRKERIHVFQHLLLIGKHDYLSSLALQPNVESYILRQRLVEQQYCKH